MDFSLQLHGDKANVLRNGKYCFNIPSALPQLDSNAHWQVGVKSIFFSGFIDIFDDDSYVVLEKFDDDKVMIDKLTLFPKTTTMFFKPDDIASALNALFSTDRVNNFLQVGTAPRRAVKWNYSRRDRKFGISLNFAESLNYGFYLSKTLSRKLGFHPLAFFTADHLGVEKSYVANEPEYVVYGNQLLSIMMDGVRHSFVGDKWLPLLDTVRGMPYRVSSSQTVVYGERHYVERNIHKPTYRAVQLSTLQNLEIQIVNEMNKPVAWLDSTPFVLNLHFQKGYCLL